MSADKKSKKLSKDKVEKKHEKDKKERRRDEKRSDNKLKSAEAAFSLLADEKAANPALAALFAAQPPRARPAPQSTPAPKKEVATQAENSAEGAQEDDNDAELSSIASDDADEGGVGLADSSPPPAPVPEKRRKRKHQEEEVEDVYMRKLAREEAREAEAAAAEREKKRQKVNSDAGEAAEDGEEAEASDAEDSEGDEDEADVAVEDEGASPPPKHETETNGGDVELSKANRTVFLANISTAAISSKSARKQLLDHLKSFLQSVGQPKDEKRKYALESIRFRSTPYASAVPKKAAFATKQLMDATAKSTNAYVVYSHQQLAREAAKQLNGTEVLGRHIRVDEVAHPSKVDHRRCVFIGNLGFVDDESNINQANEDDGREKRKPGKEPADIDEGLWRTFGKCGKVESVRVIRDSTTRVGKGIAYVQFEDANAVEAALLYDGKKFPPMLPRKLRVSRSRAQKRNAKPGSGRPTSKPRTHGYQRKVTGEEASQMGRAGKLYGRAAAAQAKKSGAGPVKAPTNGIRKPEDFVFEGHRASSTGGKAGLKLGGKGKGKKVGKPTNRSAKRAAAYKAANKGGK